LDLRRLVVDRALEIDVVDDVLAALKIQSEVDLAPEQLVERPRGRQRVLRDEARQERRHAEEHHADQRERAPLETAIHVSTLSNYEPARIKRRCSLWSGPCPPTCPRRTRAARARGPSPGARARARRRRRCR